jgi:hypothetical protein
VKLTVEVINLPDLEAVPGAELLQNLRAAVIEELKAQGYPFGSGYSVWGFHGD